MRDAITVSSQVKCISSVYILDLSTTRFIRLVPNDSDLVLGDLHCIQTTKRLSTGTSDTSLSLMHWLSVDILYYLRVSRCADG